MQQHSITAHSSIVFCWKYVKCVVWDSILMNIIKGCNQYIIEPILNLFCFYQGNKYFRFRISSEVPQSWRTAVAQIMFA